MKKILCILLALTLIFTLASCEESKGGEGGGGGEEHTHTWIEATCTAPKTCSTCGETEGEALGHDMQPATGDQPAMCSRCGYVDMASAENANVVASGTCGENLTWSLTDTGLLTFSGTGPMEDYHNPLVMDDSNAKDPPWTDGSSVPVRAVVVEEGVTSVGVGAFCGCTELYSVTLPASVTGIGAAAFLHCPILRDVSLSEGLTTIGDYAFYECSGLLLVTIPESVTSIGANPFCRCEALQGVAVKSGNQNFTSVDGVLFTADMSTLISYLRGKADAEYAIPQGVKVIGDMAFDNATGLQSVTFPDGVTTIGENAFSWSQIQSVSLPASVTSIENGAFAYCQNLQSVSLSEGVESIGDSAFVASAIQSVVIPASVTSIGAGAFTACIALEKIEMAGENQHYTCVDGVLYSADMSTLIIYPAGKAADSFTVPDGVTVDNLAFYNPINLKNVTLSAGVNDVGLALTNCPALENIETAEGNQRYTSVDGVLFSADMSTLITYPSGRTDTDYTVPDGVTSIGEQAFFGSASLENLTIPASVTSVEPWAFEFCDNLGDIYFGGSETQWADMDIEIMNPPIIHYGA